MVVFMESGDAAEVNHAPTVSAGEAHPAALRLVYADAVYVLLRMARAMGQEKARR